MESFSTSSCREQLIVCAGSFFLFYFQSIGYPTLRIRLHRRAPLHHDCTTEDGVGDSEPLRVNWTARSVLCRNAFILMIRVRIVNSLPPTQHAPNVFIEPMFPQNTPDSHHGGVISNLVHPDTGTSREGVASFSDRSTHSVTCRSL